MCHHQTAGSCCQRPRQCSCRYTITQIISAGVAVSGLAVLLLFDDSNEDSVSGRSSVLVGDALVLAGATGYAINNVLTEHILKTGDAAELLCGMGCFGLAISAVLVPTTESKAISEIEWTWLILILLAVYAVALFMFSLGMPVLLHRSGSTVRPHCCGLLTLPACCA